MKLFAKKDKCTNIPVQPHIPDIPCDTNQDKSECVLVAELREIQNEIRINNKSNYECEMDRIWKMLFGSGKYRTTNATTSGLLEQFLIEGYGKTYVPSYILDVIISKLIDYKKYVSGYENEQDIRIKLQKREKELKEQLGIK